MKILIVDDSRAMQTIVRRGIEQLGYDNLEIKKAENGKDALDIIRVWEPELVLSDWHMPEMSGLELLAALNREMLGINIGFVTTESSTAKLQEAIDAGAQFIVQKPFDFKTLHEAVLPIIQGCKETEQALQEEYQRTGVEHISLPSLSKLEYTLNRSAKETIHVKEIKPITLTSKEFPYMLALYGGPKQEAVHAIAIADLNAACILASSLGGITDDTVYIALAERALPKIIIDQSRQLFSSLETILLNKERNIHLTLRNANLMRKQNNSVDKLLEKSGEERLDTAIKIGNLDPGRLSFIVS